MLQVYKQQVSNRATLPFSCSLSRDAQLGERLRIPGCVFHCVDVQGEFASIDAVNEAAECASDPVASMAEFSPAGHVRASSAHTSLLVDRLHLSRVELERLRSVTAEDEHISVVQLNTGDWLGSDELHVVDFELRPLLTRHRCTVVTTV